MFKLLIASLLVSLACSAAAGSSAFSAGPVIEAFGPAAQVAVALDKTTTFKVAFDLSEQGAPEKVNRGIEKLARFLNMHAKAGLPAKNMHLALVVHGKAGFDLLNDAAYQKLFQQPNPNSALLSALLDKGVKITLCGQSAAYYDIGAADLVTGAELALSAMTAHALLQQQGYSLNPF